MIGRLGAAHGASIENSAFLRKFPIPGRHNRRVRDLIAAVVVGDIRVDERA
jgi:hypothetical protein